MIEKVYYCFSIKKGKDVSMIIDIFGKNQEYIFVKCDNHMTEKEEVVKKQMIDQNLKFSFSRAEEIKSFSNKEKNSLFLAFGSLYMIGDLIREN